MPDRIEMRKSASLSEMAVSLIKMVRIRSLFLICVANKMFVRLFLASALMSVFCFNHC